MATSNRAVYGFSDEAALVRAAARFLRVRPSLVKEERYPSGELKLRIKGTAPKRAIIVANVNERDAAVLRVVILAQALRDAGAGEVILIAPWIAYGRQDRPVPDSAAAGLALARLLAASFDRLATLDAHGPAFVRAFRGRLANVLPDLSAPVDVVVAPDQGARPRAAAAAKRLKARLVVLRKRRSGKKVMTDFENRRDRAWVRGKRALIVDDMADSGGTLRQAMALLRSAGTTSCQAYVTHAFDLKRLRRSLAGFGRVDAASDHAGNRLDPVQLKKLLRSA